MSFFTNLQYLIRPFIHTYIFFYILNTKYKIYRKEIYLIMKKSILFMPVLISLSIVGCTMNYNQPSSDKVIHQSSLNIDKLINANAADVEKSLGSPYYATYYIDADKLKSKNINSISIEDLKEDVSLLASYNDNQSSNSYLHIYYEDGVVKDALYGPYKIDNLDNVISASNISNADYKVSFFKNRGAICYNDFSIDKNSYFLEDSISMNILSNKFLPIKKLLDKCEKCDIFEFCVGGCLSQRYYFRNNEVLSKEFCDSKKMLFEFAKQFKI